MTRGLEGRCSIQLSYGRNHENRGAGKTINNCSGEPENVRK